MANYGTKRKLEHDGYDPFFDRLSARIRNARIHAKVTQQELALQTGLGVNAIAMLEQGRYDTISLTTCRKIAAALGRPLGDLFETEAELPERAKPPAPLDPNYVFDPQEQKFLAALREMSGKERRIVFMVAMGIRTCRDRRYDYYGRKRPKNLPRPSATTAVAEPMQPEEIFDRVTGPKVRQLTKHPVPEHVKGSPEYAWLEANARHYPNHWVALRNGVLVDWDRNRGVMVRRLRKVDEQMTGIQLAYTPAFLAALAAPTPTTSDPASAPSSDPPESR